MPLIIISRVLFLNSILNREEKKTPHIAANNTVEYFVRSFLVVNPYIASPKNNIDAAKNVAIMDPAV